MRGDEQLPGRRPLVTPKTLNGSEQNRAQATSKPKVQFTAKESEAGRQSAGGLDQTTGALILLLGGEFCFGLWRSQNSVLPRLTNLG